MKNFLIVGLLLASTNIFASDLVNITSMTNKTLDAAQAQIAKLEVVTHKGLKKVTKLKGKGTTPAEIKLNTVAQAMHTLCGFFDDGVSVALNSKDEKGSLAAVADFSDSTNISKGDADYTTLVNAVSTANKQVGVEIYSGSASGNNTAGTVLGIYDTKNQEMAIFANTNCGSDD